MSITLRSSQIRLAIGGSLLLAGAAIATLVLPDASRRLERERKARQTAQAGLEGQMKQLTELQALATQMHLGQEKLEAMEKNMPRGSIGELQWTLSRTLHDLTRKSSVRLQSVKYGTPNREGAKGTDLEAMDVEFNALGVYQNLKSFMLALEGSGLPFAVNSVRMEESPDGARLTVVLRAFRKAGAKDESREEA